MSRLWDNEFEKQKAIGMDGAMQICNRCKLPYPVSSKECDRCAHIDDDELESLRQHFFEHVGETKSRKYIAIVWGIVIACLLFIIALIAL